MLHTSGSPHGKLRVAVGAAAGHPQLWVVVTTSVQPGRKHVRQAVAVVVRVGYCFCVKGRTPGSC